MTGSAAAPAVEFAPDAFLKLAADGTVSIWAHRSDIGTGIHFKAVHMQKYYRESGLARASLPNTEWNSQRICSLPLFPAMADADADRVIAAIRELRT